MSHDRRTLRLFCIQTLFAEGFALQLFGDTTPHAPREAVFATVFRDKTLTPAEMQFLEDRLSGIEKESEALLQRIKTTADDPERIFYIDTLILLLGLFELLYRAKEIPPRAVLDESVEIAKILGASDTSYKLVNGILHKVMMQEGLTENEKPQETQS